MLILTSHTTWMWLLIPLAPGPVLVDCSADLKHLLNSMLSIWLCVLFFGLSNISRTNEISIHWNTQNLLNLDETKADNVLNEFQKSLDS